MSIGKARGFLYTLARLLGDVQAVSKGPGAVACRVARRAAGKATGQLFRRFFGWGDNHKGTANDRVSYHRGET